MNSKIEITELKTSAAGVYRILKKDEEHSLMASKEPKHFKVVCSEQETVDFNFDLLEKPGDGILIQLNGPEQYASLRVAASQWCKRRKVRVRLQNSSKNSPHHNKSIIVFFVSGIKSEPDKSGPETVRFPELGTMEVGDSFDYPFISPPYRGSYMPIGLIAAVRREKKNRGFEFETTNASAAICRVMRIK
jgi:hypothetical protein